MFIHSCGGGYALQLLSATGRFHLGLLPLARCEGSFSVLAHTLVNPRFNVIIFVCVAQGAIAVFWHTQGEFGSGRRGGPPVARVLAPSGVVLFGFLFALFVE